MPNDPRDILQKELKKAGLLNKESSNLMKLHEESTDPNPNARFSRYEHKNHGRHYQHHSKVDHPFYNQQQDSLSEDKPQDLNSPDTP